MIDFTFSRAKWSKDSEGFWVSFLVPESPWIKNFVETVKGTFSATVKKYRAKRSNNANAYAWVLMQRIAEAIGSEKDSVYLEMLRRYGQFTHLIVRPQVVERVKQEWRTVEELGEVTVNGQTGIQLRCYFGSSTYDSKEMAGFIDGIVSECKEMGIETLTPIELERLKDEWAA